MSVTTKQKPWVWMLLGAAFGLTLGTGMVLGVLAGTRSATSSPDGVAGQVREQMLQAVATNSIDTFAIATGPVGDDMEGIFTLDFLTGQLQCRVLGSRNGKWVGLFSASVVNDLGVERGKKPNYLMVTGGANFRGGNLANNLGSCVVYVVDANTGNMAAYTVPWNRNAGRTNAPQAGVLAPIQKVKVRALPNE